MYSLVSEKIDVVKGKRRWVTLLVRERTQVVIWVETSMGRGTAVGRAGDGGKEEQPREGVA